MCKKHTKFIANFNHKELNFGAMCALVSTRTIGYLGKKLEKKNYYHLYYELCPNSAFL